MVLNYYGNKSKEIIKIFREEFRGKILDVGCNEGTIYSLLRGGRTIYLKKIILE